MVVRCSVKILTSLVVIFWFVLFLSLQRPVMAVDFDLSNYDFQGQETLLSETAKNDKKDTTFYNESKDCENGVCRKEKNYAKIGVEDYSQINPWRKFYVGVDVDWFVERFGSGYEQTMHRYNFWRRFQNFDVYGGARIWRFFGAEIGYSHFGDVKAKSGRKMNIDGMFISGVFYTPHLDIFELFSLEGYASVGGAMLFNTTNGGSPFLGMKCGAGVLIKVYGTIAVNAGVDYYYPTGSFSNKGFLAVKTGVNIYLSI